MHKTYKICTKNAIVSLMIVQLCLLGGGKQLRASEKTGQDFPTAEELAQQEIQDQKTKDAIADVCTVIAVVGAAFMLIFVFNPSPEDPHEAPKGDGTPNGAIKYGIEHGHIQILTKERNLIGFLKYVVKAGGKDNGVIAIWDPADDDNGSGPNVDFPAPTETPDFTIDVTRGGGSLGSFIGQNTNGESMGSLITQWIKKGGNGIPGSGNGSGQNGPGTKSDGKRRGFIIGVGDYGEFLHPKANPVYHFQMPLVTKPTFTPSSLKGAVRPALPKP